jgi:hypothetical protein
MASKKQRDPYRTDMGRVFTDLTDQQGPTQVPGKVRKTEKGPVSNNNNINALQDIDLTEFIAIDTRKYILADNLRQKIDKYKLDTANCNQILIYKARDSNTNENVLDIITTAYRNKDGISRITDVATPVANPSTTTGAASSETSSETPVAASSETPVANTATTTGANPGASSGNPFVDGTYGGKKMRKLKKIRKSKKTRKSKKMRKSKKNVYKYSPHNA